MENQDNQIKGLIYRFYPSASELARVLGWPKQRLSRIVTGQKTPNVEEVQILANALNVGVAELVSIFLCN